MPTTRLMILVGVGVVLLAAVVFGVFTGNKGSHLELNGQVIKSRTGALDESNSVALLDFRISNPSNVSFVVREIKATLEKANGEKMEAQLTSKGDMKQLLEFNKFLGAQYNDTLSIKDKIPARGQIDRMVAARFEVPQAELDKGKAIVLWMQDMDGPEFTTTYKLH